jgi:hypothetical protein
MGRAKQIIIKVIPSRLANDFVKQHHYSGKVVLNSNLHFGCFLDDRLHGVMSYGSSTNKKKMLGLFKNVGWNEFLELNRMAFDDYLPPMSESRAISVSIKMIKKKAPHIKAIISFADASQCGDGTIYRASGFKLTSIKKNTSMVALGNGEITHKMNFSMRCSPTIARKYNPKNLSANQLIKERGYKIMEGYQLRYIYLIDKSAKLNVPEIPFSKIKEMGIGMYKGKKLDGDNSLVKGN